MAERASGVFKQFFRKRSDSNAFYAVEDVDFNLDNGKFTVITGASGSGKSTLLNMLAGILNPTQGTVSVEDTDLYKMDDNELSLFRNKNIGVIPQGQSAIYSLSVIENVLLPFTLYKGTKEDSLHADVRKKAEELLDKTGIGDLKDVMPSELSGGEMRRMAIARALINDPDVILADEPTADLDEENTKIVLEILKKAAEEGKSVLVVTHDKDVMKYADETYRMNKGKLLKEDR